MDEDWLKNIDSFVAMRQAVDIACDEVDKYHSIATRCNVILYTDHVWKRVDKEYTDVVCVSGLISDITKFIKLTGVKHISIRFLKTPF